MESTAAERRSIQSCGNLGNRPIRHWPPHNNSIVVILILKNYTSSDVKGDHCSELKFKVEQLSASTWFEKMA